jgi:hypothetical protein
MYEVSCKHVFINTTVAVSEYYHEFTQNRFNLHNKYDKNKNSLFMNVETLPLLAINYLKIQRMKTFKINVFFMNYLDCFYFIFQKMNTFFNLY